MNQLSQGKAWPALPYDAFQPTAYLLHRIVQMIGKLKLTTPFEPHWANVALWLTSCGLTTGPIPYKNSTYSIEIDLVSHQVICITHSGIKNEIKLKSTSVSEFLQNFFKLLQASEIDTKINLIPQEIEHPIPFNEDSVLREYHQDLANAFLRILMNSYQIMSQFRACFTGITPPIGFMWGTFDLRDARYINKPAPNIPKGYIERNAFDVCQIELGWWPGDSRYPKPAYYSLTFPLPQDLDKVKISPPQAFWNKDMGEFLLDYEAVRLSDNPEKDLLMFLESTYQAGAQLSGWDPELVSSGKPK